MRLLRDFKCFGTDILPLRMAARLIFLPEESILPELEVAVFAAVQRTASVIPDVEPLSFKTASIETYPFIAGPVECLLILKYTAFFHSLLLLTLS